MSALFELSDGGDETFDTLNSLHYSREETPENYVIKIAFQGLTKKELTLAVAAEDIFSVRPCLKIVGKRDNGFRILNGMINVAENASLREAAAAMNDGVLTIKVPKSEGKGPKPKPRDIEIS
ncbi:hypothetical protein M569_06837 [Genlisea aurea]|uniref:SHSP domain-containing protein n=1 Tax=Genlisea aurea TaxID=192259 RepID=S8CLB9_9LAMI|nr:hypothetical protein M569_06837 [Genlisea aurea]